jgi:hypothetical protein
MGAKTFVLQEQTQFRAGVRLIDYADGRPPLLETQQWGHDYWVQPIMDHATAIQAYFYDVVVAAFKAAQEDAKS